MRNDGNASQLRRQEWRNGWTLALASSAGMTLASLPVYTTGVFMSSLEQEFGWSRALISTGVTVNSIVGGMLAPLVGILIDRVGPRRVGIGGVLAFGATFAAVSLNTGSLFVWYGLWLLVALATGLIKPTVWTAAVASRFSSARGLAIAIALVGTPLTAMITPPVANMLLEAFGWRGAYIGVAALWLAVILPLLFLFFFGATDLWRRQGPATDGTAKAQELQGATVREALRSPTLFVLGLAALMAGCIGSAVAVHIVPMLQDKAFPRDIALELASLLGVGAIIGRISAGMILDRFDARLFGGVAFMLPALSLLGFLFIPLTPLVAGGLVLLFALGSGAELEVASYLTARYFGIRNYGAMLGIITAALALGTGTGAPLGGLVFDHFRSYDPGLMVAAPAFLICSLLLLTLPKRGMDEPATAA